MEKINRIDNPIQIPTQMDTTIQNNDNQGVFDIIRNACKEGKAWIRVFLDSPLGSPEEIQFRKMVAEGLIRTLSKVAPDIKKDKNIVPLIVEFTETILDRTKLRHHYKQGWISESAYIEQKIKHSVTLVCTVVNRLKDKTIPLLKAYLYDAYPEYAPIIDGILSWCENKLVLSQQQSENLLRAWYTFKQNAYNRAKELWEDIVDLVEKNVEPIIYKIKEYIKAINKAYE